MMRTTLTLDDDVAAKLAAQARREGRSFRDVVNETLRRGLVARRARIERPSFQVEARDVGGLQPGLSLDNIGALIEQIDGPLHR